MSTRQIVLSLLEARRGATVSGEFIAGELGISRNAVWKAVSALRADGHMIESRGKLGYVLSEQSDVLSVEGIKNEYTGREGAFIHVFPSLESTNRTAKEMAVQGAPHGTVILSEVQSAGRGRYGRTFLSPPGGLYMSLILKPNRLPFQNPTLITSVAAALTLEAIELLTDLPVQIKWVNDLYINHNKVCGILTEAIVNVESGDADCIVVGIGINVNTARDALPKNENISSLLCQGNKPVSRNRLAAEILTGLLGLKDPAPPLARYRERLLYVGEKVTVHSPKGAYEAVVLSIDEECHLLVQRDDGRREALSTGEISIRRI